MVRAIGAPLNFQAIDHAVAVCIGQVGIGWDGGLHFGGIGQPVAIAVRGHFVGAEIHRAADHAQLAIQVGRSRGPQAIESCIDAG